VSGNIEIFLVDPQILLMRALSSVLTAQQGFIVVGEADDVAGAEELFKNRQPHVVLVNVDLGAAPADAAVRRLRSSAPAVRVIGLSSAVDSQAHAQVIAAGAAGIVHTLHEPEVLFKAIRKVYAGELWLPRHDMAAIVSELVRNRSADAHDTTKIASLTKREHEIISCIAEGLRNRQVGERLFISEATVRNHVSSILDKLELSDRLELVLYAFTHGLAQSPRGSTAGVGVRDAAEHRSRRPRPRRKAT
jgi:DNA-binding NarL/FixJ family response regulator